MTKVNSTKPRFPNFLVYSWTFNISSWSSQILLDSNSMLRETHYLSICIQHDLIFIGWKQASIIRYTSCNFVHLVYCDKCRATSIYLIIVIIIYETYNKSIMTEMIPSKAKLTERENPYYRSPLVNECLPQATTNRQAQ